LEEIYISESYKGELKVDKKVKIIKVTSEKQKEINYLIH
jgi:hypothetical protein